MAERKPQWPETGDSTIAADYGAYADEIRERGVIHASTISIYNLNKAGSFRREN